jgi:hypothetical protein
MPDNLENLPTNKNKVSESEMKTANYLFKDNKDNSLKTQITSNIKEVAIAGILFFIISMSFIDNIINKYVKLENIYILLLVKTVIFMILFLIVKTFFIKT